MFHPYRTRMSAFRARKSGLVAALILLPGLMLAVAGCGGGSSDSSGGGRLQNKIVYSVGTTIYTVNPDGTGTDELFVPEQSEHFTPPTPSVSPDGSRIVFKRLSNLEPHNVSGIPPEFWVINGDRSGLRRIATFESGVGADSPRFSPDSSKILFTRSVSREVPEYPAETAICVMDANGGELKVIVQGRGYGDASFSPDGSKILYTRTQTTTVSNSSDFIPLAVYTMNTDGTGETLLATNARSPAFSPDGSRIVYIQQQPNGASEISVMNADGSAQTRLANDGYGDTNPSFSPDGTKILFASYRGLGGHLVADWGNGLLHTMNTDGSELTQLLGSGPPFDWYQVTGQAWVGNATR